MVCHRCGAINSDTALACRSCQADLRQRSKTADDTHRIFQTPLREIRPSNLSRVSDPSDTPSKPAKKANAETFPHERRAPSASAETAAGEPQRTGILPKTSFINGGLVILAGASVVLLVIAIVLLMTQQDDREIGNLFARAELLYNKQDYSAALISYREFLEKYPDSELSPLVHNRIDIIHQKLMARKPQPEPGIEELIRQAEQAYEKQQYLVPEDNNVIMYTTKILERDPTHPRALELQALVVNFYQEQAESALRKRRYSRAIQYYEKILKILPGDQKTLDKLSKLKK